MVHRPWRDCSSQVWFRCGGPLLATWGAEFGGEDRSKTRCLLHFRWRAEFCWKEGWRFEEDLVATYLSWRYKDTTIESGLCITIIAGFCFFASELWAFAVHFIINFYVQLRWILSLSYRKLARKLRKSGQRGPILFLPNVRNHIFLSRVCWSSTWTVVGLILTVGSIWPRIMTLSRACGWVGRKRQSLHYQSSLWTCLVSLIEILEDRF